MDDIRPYGVECCGLDEAVGSKELGVSIWQKSFFDRVIRGEKDYLEIWQYIDENPLKWVSDELYIG